MDMPIQMREMLVTVLTAAYCLYLTTTSAGAYDMIMHNYGYMLKEDREIQVATYNARMVFHLRLPEWQIDFRHNIRECVRGRARHRNCTEMVHLVKAAADIKARTELYLQKHIRYIHETVMDLPIGIQRTRGKRGFFTDAISKITGLATKDELSSVTEMFQEIQTGILQANKMWGDSSKSLLASFKVDQKRFKNVFRILGEFRRSIRQMQLDLIHMQHTPGNMLMAEIFRLVSWSSFQTSEVESLYNGVQLLLSGNIPHSIVSHKAMQDALDTIRNHLNNTAPHMLLCRSDLNYYFSEAKFHTFRSGDILFLIIQAPVTTKFFAHPINLYELIKFPVPTPESSRYYTMLATDIKMLGFSHSADYILEIPEGRPIPFESVWPSTSQAVRLLDRSKHSCAAALINGDLLSIKSFCRFNVNKAPFPRSATRLYKNSYLLTNISTVDMHCLNQTSQHISQHETFHLTHIQQVYSFRCYCDMIQADEYLLTTDSNLCNESQSISSTVDVQFGINLAYLSEFFDMSNFYNLTADSLLNHSVEIRLPDLAIADKRLDQEFGLENAASFDMTSLINNTQNDVLVYENLQHYLFNRIMQSHSKQSDFDFLNPYTWLTIIGWITSAIAIIMVLLLHFRVRSMTILLMARGSHALPTRMEIPKIIGWTTTPYSTQTSVNMVNEWMKHVAHVPNVLPVEVLILLCLVLFFIFKILRSLYKKRQQETVRTKLYLELGDSVTSSVIPITGLAYNPQSYRFVINKSDIKFLLIEHNLSAELRWKDGIQISNLTLSQPVILPTSLSIDIWKIKLLRSLLNGPFYAAIQIVNGLTNELSDIVVLRTLVTEPTANLPYPSEVKMYHTFQ